MFFCWNEEGMLSFVSEKIKLFYRINLLGTAFKQKNKLPFKLLKPQFIGRTHVQCNLQSVVDRRALHIPMAFNEGSAVFASNYLNG